MREGNEEKKEMNHIQGHLESIFPDDYEFIPMNMIPSKYMKFSFEDFDQITFTCEDENLQILIDLLVHQLKKIIEIYGEKFIFSQPSLHFQPHFGLQSPRIGIKIGMMEKKNATR